MYASKIIDGCMHLNETESIRFTMYVYALGLGQFGGSKYFSHIIDSDVTGHTGFCRSELWQRSQCHRWSCRKGEV